MTKPQPQKKNNNLTAPVPPEKVKKKRKKNYFTKDHELAIVAYALSDDNKVRTKLYITMIQPVFDEMVDKIIYTYKYNSLPNIEVLAEDCKLWLTTILNKYDPEKKFKAFSYFTVVTRNWFKYKAKKNARAARIESNFETCSGEIEESQPDKLNAYEEMREYREFWNHLWGEINSWEDKMSLKENDKKVYEAVIIILNSIEDINVFNKKAIYLYLREITKLNTKQIVNSLNKMRKFYSEFRKDWNEGKI